MLTCLLPLALLAISSVDAAGHKEYASEMYHKAQHNKRAESFASGHHWTRDLLPGTGNRSSVRRGMQQKRSVSKGSLTESEGCTQFYTVQKGDSCYSAIATVQGGLTLEEFYELNPQVGVKENCYNLWHGFDYCVSRKKGAKPVKATAKKIAKVKVAVKEVQKKVTTNSAAPSTTKPAARVAPSSAASTEGDDEECDTDDVEAPAATTSSKPAEQKKVAPQTTQAPAPTTTEAPAPTTEAAKTIQANAVKPKPTTTTTSAAAPAETSSGSSGGSDLLSRLGVTGFLGKNTGIGSWFHTNLNSDSTNGNSWCGCPYNDDTPGFAPSVGTMLGNFGGNYPKAASAYCGLEAKFTNPNNGKTTILYVGDGFDDQWVRTPGSVDIVFNHFADLFGSTTNNKDDVIQGLEWEFTGNRRNDLLFEQCKGYVPIDKIGFQ